ncbi:MAG: LacI family transcriptional regulator [Glaciihabitans sp.]|nr:LacI family transcriptional regulator [Glaciihabitans sp.]
MKDVADRVGMSRQLVSLVLRDKQGATEETRQKVRAAAQELGYRPNESARLLRSQRTHQLGVLFDMRQPFEVDLVDSLYRAAKTRGYRLALATMGADRRESVALEELLSQRIEALLVLASESGENFLRDLPGNIPIIQVGGPHVGGLTDDIRSENQQGLDLAVTHLVELGHTLIAYADAGDGPNAPERLSGYRQSMSRHGLINNIDVIPAGYSEEKGYTVARHLLSREQLPTAIVCCNDRCAFGLVETLVRAGVRIPEDISVIGFDDSTIARLPFVQLTSVRSDSDRMAHVAIEATLNRLQHPHGEDWAHPVETSLTIRQTTGVARAS